MSSGSLAGAAHLPVENGGVLRCAECVQKSLVDQKGKSLLVFYIVNMIANRESIRDVVLSSTRQHGEPVDATTREHDEQLRDQLVVVFLCCGSTWSSCCRVEDNATSHMTQFGCVGSTPKLFLDGLVLYTQFMLVLCCFFFALFSVNCVLVERAVLYGLEVLRRFFWEVSTPPTVCFFDSSV